jgi:hypothetical protein
MITDCTGGNGKENITGDKQDFSTSGIFLVLSFIFSLALFSLNFMNENVLQSRRTRERNSFSIF